MGMQDDLVLRSRYILDPETSATRDVRLPRWIRDSRWVFLYKARQVGILFFSTLKIFEQDSSTTYYTQRHFQVVSLTHIYLVSLFLRA